MDSSDKNVLCRLCLKKLSENCEPIEEILQHTLSFLTLCPNLTISDDPMMCETCAVNLKKCFDFKVRCMSTEDCIASFVEGEGKKVVLRDIYSKVKLDGNINRVPGGHNVCRFCLELVKDDASTSERHDVDLLAILQKYFLEQDLRITDNIIACRLCYDSLRFHVSFVNNYLSIEEKISEYCQVEGTNYKDQVDLRDVATFISKSMLNVENNSSLIIKEDKQEDIVHTNVEIKFEDSTDAEEEGEKLVDMEIQQNNNSFQHHPSSQSDRVPQLIGTKPTKYKCDMCDYETKRKNDLKKHMPTHKTPSEITMYKCQVCIFETRRKDYLQLHTLTHMDKSKIEMHKCEVCLFETKWKKNLRKHLLSHRYPTGVGTTGIIYKCDLCDYGTKWKCGLKKHILTHKTPSEIIMYKCQVCVFETKRKDCLQRHMRVHMDVSEIKMHKCEMCHFETKWKKNLQAHMVCHINTPDVATQGTTYKCDLCDYKTKRKFAVERHVLTHNNRLEITIHKCDLCDYEAKRKSALKRHMFTH